MKNWTWFERGFLIWVVVLLGITAIHFHPVDLWLEGQLAPAWVQAFGVIVGLLIAVAVPAWQHWLAAQKEERQAADTARHLAKVAVDIANSAVFAVEAFCNEATRWERGSPFNPRSGLLDQCNRQIEHLQTRLLQEASLTNVARAMGLVWRPVSFCFDTSKQWSSRPWHPTSTDISTLKRRAEIITAARDRLAADVARYLDEKQ